MREICTDCGKTYDAGKYTFLCPQCRKKRLSNYAKQNNLNKIGNDAYSKIAAERRVAAEGGKRE